MQPEIKRIDGLLTGLQGGARKIKGSINGMENDDLMLINRGTDCFVNSVLQLIRNTEYVRFIKTHGQTLLQKSSKDSYKLLRLLAEIYSEESVQKEVSVALVRSYVAKQSGKQYLDTNTQQDAVEFFRALEAVFHEEFLGSDEFEVTRDLHWGKEQVRRKFVDISETGSCLQCGNFPINIEEPFLILQLRNLPRATGVTLSALISAYFSEDIETFPMRCSFCCEQQVHQGSCPRIGLCKDRNTVEIRQLTKYPTYLMIQLIRNIGLQPKVLTFVKIEKEIDLLKGQKYELIGTLDHKGESTTNGHYVTFLKDGSGQWRCFDDKITRKCRFQEANTRNNYLLLFKKKEELNDINNRENENDPLFMYQNSIEAKETNTPDMAENPIIVNMECENVTNQVAESRIVTSSKNVHNSHEGITETATNSADNVCVNIWQNNFSKPIQNHAMDKPKRNVDEPVEQNKTGITKRKKIKEMNEDEKRQYNREQ